MTRYLLIANPAAGSGRSADAIEEVQQILNERGVDYELMLTTAPKNATTLARLQHGRFDAVIAMGGDGTVSEVAAGMVHTSVPMGIIPSGSCNDFVKIVGIPAQLEKAVDVLLSNNIRDVDAGMINDRYFINNVGIGFDGEVNRLASTDHGTGTGKHTSALLNSLGRYDPPLMKVTMNGKVLDKKIFQITIGNGPICGGGFRLTPDAVVDDGLFDVLVINSLGVFSRIIHLPKVLNGTVTKTKHAVIERAPKLTVTSHKPLPIHIDGEVYASDNCHIEILPKALKILAGRA